MSHPNLNRVINSLLIRYTASKGLLDQLDQDKPLARKQEDQRNALKYIHEQGIENQIEASIKVSLRASMKVDKAVLEALGVEVK